MSLDLAYLKRICGEHWEKLQCYTFLTNQNSNYIVVLMAAGQLTPGFAVRHNI